MDYPPFSDAVTRLREFLYDCQAPTVIEWVALPDVACSGGILYLRPRRADMADAAARSKYEAAIPRRLGVKLASLCQIGSVSYCYVYRPSNRLEAEQLLMPDGLKLSVPVRPREAILVTDQDKWKEIKALDCDLRYKRSLFS